MRWWLHKLMWLPKKCSCNHSSSPVLFLGAEMWEGAWFLRQLVLCRAPLAVAASQVLRVWSSFLGSRIAKRCWENPSNAALTMSACNRTSKYNQKMLLWPNTKQVKFLLCHCLPSSRAEGGDYRVEKMYPEKTRKRAKLKIVTDHYTSTCNSLPQADPISTARVTKRWGFSWSLQWTYQTQLTGLQFASLSSSVLPFVLHQT